MQRNQCFSEFLYRLKYVDEWNTVSGLLRERLDTKPSTDCKYRHGFNLNPATLSALVPVNRPTNSEDMRKEEKPTRCHWMLYCTYDILNMFRALLCPSSRARDYMCFITAYGVQCSERTCNIPLSGRTACCPAPTPTTSNQTLHTITHI